mmetsp:Transcript_16117/g.35018  ORF Transcript_16117/g.35018 Transcript_16117/m.35018 type:complete len:289 (+) Transcript_16117:138-1004(+)
MPPARHHARARSRQRYLLPPTVTCFNSPSCRSYTVHWSRLRSDRTPAWHPSYSKSSSARLLVGRPAEHLLARLERPEEDASPQSDPHHPRRGPLEERGRALLPHHPHHAIRDALVHRPAVPLRALSHEAGLDDVGGGGEEAGHPPGQRSDAAHLRSGQVPPPRQARPDPLELVVRNKLDDVEGHVAQHERAVAGVQPPPHPLLGNHPLDGAQQGFELASLHALLHHLRWHTDERGCQSGRESCAERRQDVGVGRQPRLQSLHGWRICTEEQCRCWKREQCCWEPPVYL